MKAFFILLACLLLFQRCQKDYDGKAYPTVLEKGSKPKTTTATRNDKIGICHLTDNGSYLSIEVSQSALPSHLAHGDYVSDGDNDGYTAVGACVGTANDCNDNDPGVNPGATEVCGDGLDNNCDGNVDENCCTAPADILGHWTGVITRSDGFTEPIELNITSQTITVTYPNSQCSGTWAINCAIAVPVGIVVTENITSGSCTPIECVIEVRYSPAANGLIFFNRTSDNCTPTSPFPVRGNVILI